MTAFELITADAKPYLYVERRSAMGAAEMGEKMASAFAEVWGHMQNAGIAPGGAALAVYYEYGPGEVTWRAGFFIARDDMGKASGNVKADATPAGRVLRGLHRGSYAGLPKSYGQMYEFVQENSLTFTAPTWEVYLNDPGEVSEEALETELFQAIEA